MTVGDRLFAGKGAREEAAKALTYAVLSWRDDPHLEHRATFRGFEILSRGKRSSMTIDEAPPLPDLFLKGLGIYTAHLNTENPLGTVQSLEHALRSLDKLAAQEQDHISRLEKTLSDYPPGMRTTCGSRRPNDRLAQNGRCLGWPSPRRRFPQWV